VLDVADIEPFVLRKKKGGHGARAPLPTLQLRG